MKMFAIGACVLLFTTATAAKAQNVGCNGPDSVSALFSRRVSEIVTARDSAGMAFRQKLQLPQVGAADVDLVSDSATCAIAAESNRQKRTPGNSVASPVYVLRVGTTRFVVFDLQTKWGEWFPLDIYDSTFHYIVSMML